jgi:hypothetical protein
MVEHTQTHPRLQKQTPPGRREKLTLGTLFLPAGRKAGKGAAIFFFFHGGTWLPEVAAAQDKAAVVTVQAGSGSAVYARLFDDASRFPALLKEAESQAGMRFDRVMLGGWNSCWWVTRATRRPIVSSSCTLCRCT